MGRIIGFSGESHRDIQSLLPWYVTGRLDPADQERVHAHLQGCAACSAQLGIDEALGRELALQPANVEQGWAALRERLALDAEPIGRAHEAPALPARATTQREAKRFSWPRIGWMLGPQLALASCLGALFLLQTPRYAGLDGGTGPAEGNLIVIFDPSISESGFRRALRESDARLVDGPTAANAYIVQVPAARRDRVLALLRERPQILLAEPIEPGSTP